MNVLVHVPHIAYAHGTCTSTRQLTTKTFTRTGATATSQQSEAHRGQGVYIIIVVYHHVQIDNALCVKSARSFQFGTPHISTEDSAGERTGSIHDHAIDPSHELIMSGIARFSCLHVSSLCEHLHHLLQQENYACEPLRIVLRILDVPDPVRRVDIESCADRHHAGCDIQIDHALALRGLYARVVFKESIRAQLEETFCRGIRLVLRARLREPTGPH